jgi:hypothetical protein
MNRIQSNASEYAIRKIRENRLGLETNGTHQLLVNTNHVNLLSENKSTIKKYKEATLDDSK